MYAIRSYYAQLTRAPQVGGAVVGLHDHHVAAVAAASVEETPGGGPLLHGRDDLQEGVSDREDRIAEPEDRNAGVAGLTKVFTPEEADRLS